MMDYLEIQSALERFKDICQNNNVTDVILIAIEDKDDEILTHSVSSCSTVEKVGYLEMIKHESMHEAELDEQAIE